MVKLSDDHVDLVRNIKVVQGMNYQNHLSKPNYT